MIQPSIRQFTASDGYSITFRYWQAERPRGIVIALHGIQSHSGWYEASSRAMAEAGFDVYFADRRGSGLNEIDRGHAIHGWRLIQDVRALTALARLNDHSSNASHQSLPVTVMGLSWGGKIAAATVALFPEEFSGLALLYPGLQPRIRPNAWQRFRLNLARRLEVTKSGIPLPLGDPALFTDSPKWRQFISDDALALRTVSSSVLNAGRDLDRLFALHANAIHCPTLLMLAGRDKIIDNARTKLCVCGLEIRHLTSIVYPEACHTLEFEPNRAAIFTELTDWLRQRHNDR